MNITKETNDLVCVPHSCTDDESIQGLAEMCDMNIGCGLVIGKGVIVCEPVIEQDVIEMIKRFNGE